MTWLKVLTITLIFLIAVSLAVSLAMANIYSSYKGSIEGTGFIKQEMDGAGGINFDVDDFGNIYFAVTSPFNSGIVVYNEKGVYIYTLPLGGHFGVKIDERNNILVCYNKGGPIEAYNKNGIYISSENDISYSQQEEFFHTADENIRERNGIRYINNDGTITKAENGIETVVFTVPTWQRWYRAFMTILILSCVAMVLRFAIPQWIKASKDHNERREKKKLQRIEEN